MKKTFLAFIIFIPYYISPQSFKIGTSFDLMLGNENLSIEIGPAINLEYLLYASQVSITGCARLHYSELNNNTFKFSWSYSYTVYSIGAIIKYYPIKWDIEPYLACGIFYNFIDKNSSEMPTFINGYIVSTNIVEHNTSTEITGGLILSAKTPFNIIVEITQSFNKPAYDLVQMDFNNKITTSKEKFNFNALIIKMGIRFGL